MILPVRGATVATRWRHCRRVYSTLALNRYFRWAFL